MDKLTVFIRWVCSIAICYMVYHEAGIFTSIAIFLTVINTELTGRELTGRVLNRLMMMHR